MASGLGGSLRGACGGWGCGVWDLCFWFPGCDVSCTVRSLCGGLCGVCGTGLLFENYIVDASIFYKKQFPRYMNLDLSLLSGCAFGCGLVVVVVFMVLSKE